MEGIELINSKKARLKKYFNNNGQIIRDPVEIANNFNKFFINIADTLMENKPSLDNNFRCHLKRKPIWSNLHFSYQFEL